jgi:mRNA-degrading endonuclease RelE of RelBE toxin-antitoxin system
MAKVIVTPQAARAIEALPLVVHARVISLLDRLELWPVVSGAKPLSGKLAGRYRLRTGDYRVEFRVQGDTITVEKVGHRDRFYD